MEHTTSLREKALNWWNSWQVGDSHSKYKMCRKYNFATPPSDSIIEEMYLKEHPILCKHCYAPKRVETGLCSSCGKFPTTSHLKEHPTEAEGEIGDEKWIETMKRMSKIPEAEVSKEEETVEQVCKLHYENLMLSANKAAHNLYETGFYSGSNWQKEKDRELIKGLLGIVNTFYESINVNDYQKHFISEIKKQVGKATQYLNETNQTAKSMEATDQAKTNASEAK